MSKKFYIESYCHIKKNVISMNETELFSNEDLEFSRFIKSAAKHFKLEYPKFYKMDDLSKLAFLAADILLKEPEENENIAILISNRASSLDTDRTYQNSISNKDNYYPSPAVFVYTLPNICIGEISIRHQLHSESAFFVFEQFNPEHLFINADYLLKYDKAEKALCGWIDFDNNNYEAFLYLVSENGNIAHAPKEILSLYHTK